MPDGTTPPSAGLLAGPTPSDTRVFPLLLAGDGERVRIVSCRAGKGLERRLRDLGIPLGVDVDVVQRRASGVVLGRGAARIALGHSAAQKVLVELIAGAT